MISVALSELADINPAGPAAGEISPTDLCYFVPMSALCEDGQITELEMRPYVELARGYTAFRGDDVLMAKITPCYENNKIGLARVNRAFAFGSTEFHVIRCKQDSLDPAYLTHFLRQDRIRFLGERRMTGSGGQRRVPRTFLEELQIPLPELPEQRRIAGILDRAGHIRRKRERALSLTDEFLRSAFVEMFGDPVVNPKGFLLDQIRNHLSKSRAGAQSGPFGSSLKKHEYVNFGVPVWGVDNVQQNQFVADAKLFITKDKFEQLQRYSVLSGDILISRAGTVGRMCIAEPAVEHSIISTNLVRVVLDTGSLLPEYFVALFTYLPHRLGALKANNKESAFTFLNPGTLKELQIPIPPIRLQAEYRLIAQKVRNQAGTAGHQLRELNSLFAALSQRAFRGEL
jgi:type I restriction enzyme S subunit